ncbi:MAG: hypothetical protein Q7J12_05335, partial [Syntrophales bacterium]|nr:hypothetical protein [Syntrophales bacterium]
MERKFWDPKLIPWEELKAIQWERLKKQIKYCYDNSPLYYKRRFDEIGVKPEDIRTWEDFQRLPIMGSKEEERKSQEESMEKLGHPFGTYLCAPPENVRYITSTGGTTGTPTFTYLYTEKDMGMLEESVARIFWWAGLKPGDLVANIFAQSMHWFGFVGNHILSKAGFSPIPLGAEAGSERMLRLIDTIKPKVVIGTPPLVEHLIEKCPSILGKDVRALQIKILILGGAPGAGIPSVRKKLEDAYGAKVFDMQPMWVSCDSPEYYGMHYICPDQWVFAEDLVDPETNHPLEIADGVIGHGLCTNFTEAKPMLKYAFGDLLQVFTKECPGCGFKGLRVRIVGRADEMLMVKGVNVYPTAVKGVINTFLPRVTGEMRIVLDEPGPAITPPLKVRVEYAKGLSKKEIPQLKAELEETIRAR